jgi:hypothetical protein
MNRRGRQIESPRDLRDAEGSLGLFETLQHV